MALKNQPAMKKSANLIINKTLAEILVIILVTLTQFFKWLRNIFYARLKSVNCVRSVGWFYFTEEFGLKPSCVAESSQKTLSR